MFTELTLTGSYREIGYQVKTLAAVRPRETFIFADFYRTCAAIRADRRVSRVLVHVKPGFRALTVAALEEVRGELVRLAEAGKELVFYAGSYSDQLLYLASACKVRIMHPLGELRCVGLSRSTLYFKQLADRYDLSVQVYRRGRYKSAADRFRLDAIDPSDLEQFQRCLDVSVARLHDTIRAGYGASQDSLADLLGGRILDADEALEAGWIDAIRPLDTLRAQWLEEKVRKRSVKTPRRAGMGKRIAVLCFEGMIVEGKNRENPILGQSMGSESFVRQIDSLRKSRRVRAVVLRVNSGGGSAVASEDIRTALVRLAQKKPLVVSMSEVAGSGGYWISMTGSPIFARSTTVTGSIGVLNLHVGLGETLTRLGITHATIRTHDHADAGSSLRPLTADESAQIDRQVASVYDRFVRLVAETRGMTMEDVDARGQGRVWTGDDAAAEHLVDRIGGLSDAIEEARRVAGIDRARIQFLPHVKHSLIERLVHRRGASAASARPGGIDGFREPAGTLRAIVALLANLTDRPLLIEPGSIFLAQSLDAWLDDQLDTDLQIE
jgi:protease IV